MSIITKDLGAVTAYAYAVEQGYTGTEEEFAELMADYAAVEQRAAQSAQTATEKAQEASASATSASQSASSASASATSASQSATTATAKASEAQQGATTATTKAQEASQSASESAQSAQTAVQAKEDAQTAKTASETAQGIAETARDEAVSARDTAQQYAESIDPEKLIGAYPVDTATGAIASFPDGADNIPMKKVTVRIELKQAGTGDPSHDNVRPITGWTGAVVSHSGADMTNPTTYPITFPSEAGTVYGGELDVTNGTLTVDRAMVDLGTLSWALDGSRLKARIDNMANKAGRTVKMACSCFKALTNGEPYDASANFVCYGAYSYIYVHDFAYTDIAAFKTAVTGQQLAYELATPITYQLTPTEIRSLLGTNNVFADTGDSTAEYRADTKLYIQKKITEAVNALT